VHIAKNEKAQRHEVVTLVSMLGATGSVVLDINLLKSRSPATLNHRFIVK
jgi:hypothetical protein